MRVAESAQVSLSFSRCSQIISTPQKFSDTFEMLLKDSANSKGSPTLQYHPHITNSCYTLPAICILYFRPIFPRALRGLNAHTRSLGHSLTL